MFEYKTITMYEDNPHIRTILPRARVEQRLNDHAKEGWRVVSFDYDCTVLERPVDITQDLRG